VDSPPGGELLGTIIPLNSPCVESQGPVPGRKSGRPQPLHAAQHPVCMPQQKLVHAAFDYCAEANGQRGSVWFNYGPTAEGRYQLQGYTSVFTRSNSTFAMSGRDAIPGRTSRPAPTPAEVDAAAVPGRSPRRSVGRAFEIQRELAARSGETERIVAG
jgi:hypothetical protein